MNYIVTTSLDSGPGSLREIVGAAVANSTINFSVNTVNLTSSAITITTPLTINGPGVTISQTGSDGIFFVNVTTGNVTINGNSGAGNLLTITGGNNPGTAGGIFVFSGDLFLSYCNITENSGNAGGVFISVGATGYISYCNITNNNNSTVGGIFINGGATVYLSYCNINNNINGSNAGGIFIETGATVYISYCDITNNSGNAGGGLYINPATVHISFCNITNNNANASEGVGGGIFVSGTNNSTTIIVNSNISGNTAANGGGLFISGGEIVLFDDLVNGNNATGGDGGGLSNIEANILIINSTISSNISSVSGGGINNFGNITIGNTIVADNTATDSSPDVSGFFNSQGYNLIGNVAGSTGFPASGDIIGVNPLLGPYAKNGGPTESRVLLPGSMALNTGSTALLAQLATYDIDTMYDQRGPGFPRVIGGTIDIGSIEDIIVICYAGHSKILVKDMHTDEISWINAEDVVSSVHQVYDVEKEIYVPVVINAVTRSYDKFYVIPKDALGLNQPSEDFYVTSGHIIIVDGVKTKARDIPQAKLTTTKPMILYSICTANGCPIRINNLDVMTWSRRKFLEYVRSKGMTWMDNTKQVGQIYLQSVR